MISIYYSEVQDEIILLSLNKCDKVYIFSKSGCLNECDRDMVKTWLIRRKYNLIGVFHEN